MSNYQPAFTATTLHALAALADQGHDPEALVIGAQAFANCLPKVAPYDGQLRAHCQMLDTHDTALAAFAELAWREGYEAASADRAAVRAAEECAHDNVDALGDEVWCEDCGEGLDSFDPEEAAQ